MRAAVLSGQESSWEVRPRSAAELKEAAAHYEQAAALCNAPVQKAAAAQNAVWCHQAAAMPSYTEIPSASPSEAGAAPPLIGIALALAVAVTAIALLAARAVARK